MTIVVCAVCGDRPCDTVRRIARALSPEKPHSIDDSLALHGLEGERPPGLDNARPVARQRRGAPQGHRHRLRGIRPYEYRDVATLLADSWATVGGYCAKEA